MSPRTHPARAIVLHAKGANLSDVFCVSGPLWLLPALRLEVGLVIWARGAQRPLRAIPFV